MPRPKRFLFLGSLPHVHAGPHVALHAVPRAQQVWDAPARRSAEPADIASVLPRQRENWGWLLGNPTLQASTSSPHWPQTAAFEALLLWREKHRAGPPRWRPQALTSCSNAAGEQAGREGGRGRGGGPAAPTLPPPMPMPQLLSLSSWRVKQAELLSRASKPRTPSGPKALSLRSSSTSCAPAVMSPSPSEVWTQRRFGSVSWTPPGGSFYARSPLPSAGTQAETQTISVQTVPMLHPGPETLKKAPSSGGAWSGMQGGGQRTLPSRGGA